MLHIETQKAPCEAKADSSLPHAVVMRRRRVHLRELSILISVLVGIAVFAALNPRFLSWESAKAILLGASTDGLMVVGMTIVIVCGAFDLSIGSTMAAGGLTAGAVDARRPAGAGPRCRRPCWSEHSSA